MLLRQLNAEDSFRFLYTDRFRNLKVGRVSDSSATISGEILQDNVWKPLGLSYTITPDVEVEKVDETYYIRGANSISSISDSSFKNPKIKKEKKEVIVRDENYVPGKRGRKPSGIVIDFPFNKNFTIKEISERNDNISPSNVNIYLKKNYPNAILVEKIKTSSGRGKPTNVYMIKK